MNLSKRKEAKISPFSLSKQKGGLGRMESCRVVQFAGVIFCLVLIVSEMGYCYPTSYFSSGEDNIEQGTWQLLSSLGRCIKCVTWVQCKVICEPIQIEFLASQPASRPDLGKSREPSSNKLPVFNPAHFEVCSWFVGLPANGVGSSSSVQSPYGDCPT